MYYFLLLSINFNLIDYGDGKCFDRTIRVPLVQRDLFFFNFEQRKKKKCYAPIINNNIIIMEKNLLLLYYYYYYTSCTSRPMPTRATIADTEFIEAPLAERSA